MKTRAWRCWRLLGFLGLGGIVLFQGCAGLGTYNPATGRSEFIFISTPTEMEMGQKIHRDLQQEFGFSSDQEKKERLRRIGARLARVSDRQDYPYHFYLIEKDELNAFTTPGGNIYMFTGLMDRLASDDEIAAVLGHEIGHCSARHTIKKFQAAFGYNLIGSILMSQLEAEAQMKELVAQSSNAVMSLIFSAYSRADEFEADRLGLKYMHLAGYDPAAMLETFEVLKAEAKGPNVPLIFRTHPYIVDRAQKVKEEIKKISAALKFLRGG